MANNHSKETQYTQRLEKVFPMLMEQKQMSIQDQYHKETETIETEMVSLYEKISRLSQEGKTPEEIAKQLKIGVGEVKLMLSLYAMR
ncbi:MAG: DUF6115 domain-containing protein [Cellulosilyticaceae bacterium]